MTEFSRLVRLDTLGGAPRPVAIVADPAECTALARRFGLAGIEALSAEAELVRKDDVIEARGRLRGAVIQSCVASGEPVPATIDEAFLLRFVPLDRFEAEGDEIELSEADCDTIPYEGGAVDLGEAVAETLALALPPFPRSPNAEAVLRAAGVIAEEEAGPFSALKTLRDRMADG